MLLNSISNLSTFSLPTGKVLQPLRVRSLPGGGPRVVVHVIDAAAGISAHFPAGRKRLRTLPSRAATIVVDIVGAPVLIKPMTSAESINIKTE